MKIGSCFFRRAVSALLLVAALMLGTGVAMAAPAAMNLVVLDILTVNDFHGALAADGQNPGAAVLAGYIKAQAGKNPAATLIVSAGDMFQGTPDSNMLYGKPVVQFMNAVGFDAMALGNHEFDWGLPVLKERMREAEFPFIAANLVDAATGKPADFVKSYTIIEKAGIKVGLVGIIIPDTMVTTNPANIRGLVIADPVAALKKLVPELRAMGAEVIIVVSHLASAEKADRITGDAAEVAWSVPGIDAIVSGHSHQKLAGKVNGIPLVQAAHSGREVARISLVYARDAGRVIASTADVYDVPEHNWAPDRTVERIVAKAKAEVEPIQRTFLGRLANALPHDRHKLSPLGQWIADVMRATAKTDIALENGGGIRAGLEAGAITAGNIYRILPFDDRLCRIELSGAQIREALEHGIGNNAFGMLQFSGLKVKYDVSLPPGARVVSALLADGRELADDKFYSVATNDFLLAGGDGFSMLKGAGNVTAAGIVLRDAVGAAVKAAQNISFTADERLVIIGLPAKDSRPAA